MSEVKVTVRSAIDEAIDVKSFELVPERGSVGSIAPGSHIDVHLENGIVRQYSLLNGPNESTSYRIAVKREQGSRGGSRALHDDVRAGDTLLIGAPRNNFKLHEKGRHTVLIAGGIGITPLLSMMQFLDARGESFELQYFSRSRAHAAFHEVLSQKKYASRVGFHYALDPEAVRAYLRKHLWHHPDGAHLYICGPRPFMDIVEQTASRTWPPESVHLEYFSADAQSLAGPRDVFVVRCARSGGDFEVAENESIVEALAKHQVHIEMSCEQGVCGTCLTGVIEGVPDHRDVFLTEEEKLAGDRMLPCVSRARSNLIVLDV